jgi:hypothetical protein
MKIIVIIITNFIFVHALCYFWGAKGCIIIFFPFDELCFEDIFIVEIHFTNEF